LQKKRELAAAAKGRKRDGQKSGTIKSAYLIAGLGLPDIT
jgi:hypothetical protein